MIEMTINDEQVVAKFGFKALFDANKKYSNHNADGVSLEDGAAMMFYGLINEDPTTLVSIIDVTVPGKYSDDDIYSAIETLTDGGEKIAETLTQFKEELIQSGFFKKAIDNQVKAMEKALAGLKKKENVEDQVKGLVEMIKLFKENI